MMNKIVFVFFIAFAQLLASCTYENDIDVGNIDKFTISGLKDGALVCCANLEIENKSSLSFQLETGELLVLAGESKVGVVQLLKPVVVPGHSSKKYVQWVILSGGDSELDAKTTESFHLLEHMVARWTSRQFPNGIDNFEQMARHGVKSNARTEDTLTSYFMRAPLNQFPFILHLALPTIRDFKLDESLFREEQQAVIQELKELASDPWTHLDDLQWKILFPGTPRARSIEEHIESATHLTADKIETMYRHFYRPTNMVLVLAGPKRLLEQNLSTLSQLDPTWDEGQQRRVAQSPKWRSFKTLRKRVFTKTKLQTQRVLEVAHISLASANLNAAFCLMYLALFLFPFIFVSRSSDPSLTRRRTCQNSHFL